MRLFSISSSLNSRAHYLYQKIRMQFSSTKPNPTRLPGKLYKRISHVGDPNLSIVPVLDDWVGEGHSVYKTELVRIIKELMSYKRFKHALEVSLWMTNKRRIPISPYDIAIRLKLIHKLFGLEEVENYLKKIPEGSKTHSVYLALLNCYTIAKSVDKAEGVMQKARDLGYVTMPIWYNLMMNLHYKLGNREKIEDLLNEMEEKCISYDQFTLSVCFSVCASASDAVGMDKIIDIMESKRAGDVHWRSCINVAEGYLRMGLIDKALVILKKLEGQLITSDSEDNKVIFVLLFKLYGEAGKRDELYRIWDLYKKKGKFTNKVCSSMMRSLMKFDDIEEVEKVFEEWESRTLLYDFEIPNFLIDAYCRDGHPEKAEALITRGISKGADPKVMTWCHLAGGYLKRNQLPEAVEALNKAISIFPRHHYVSQKNNLSTCLRFLEKGGCVDKAEELINFIRMGGLSTKVAPEELQGLVEDTELQHCGENESSEEIFDQHINDQGSFQPKHAKQA